MTGSSEQIENVSAYLRDLAERLARIPVMYGVNGADIDRLREIAEEIEFAHDHHLEMAEAAERDET